MSATAEVISLHKIEVPWRDGLEEVSIGKDVLELLSSSMYVDPMSVYREYLQNAADAIDDARNDGVLGRRDRGKVGVFFDFPNRSLRIRDNGCGIPTPEFVHRITAFGGSKKRGTTARGFRGVGRLAGIGYCQELVFRTRAANDSRVNELRWDCRKIKTVLRATDFKGDLADLVRQVVTWRQVEGRGLPDHFFEVELRGIVRHGNDVLLDPNAIHGYLSQTAPLPFSPSFKMGEKISADIDVHIGSANLELQIEGIGHVYRPHQNDFKISDSLTDAFSEIEFLRVPALDGTLGAVGWILHHGYKGAIPTITNFRGLRVRVGNIQVGGSNLLEELFAEPRFNAWTVGEIHVLDSKVIPNGRRDHFEQNVHYLNLLNHLSPVAREVSKRCRTSSIHRNWIRQFEQRKGVARGKLALLRQGTGGSTKRSRVFSEAQEAVNGMEKIVAKEALPQEVRRNLAAALGRIQSELTKIKQQKQRNALSRMRGPRRKAYEQVIALIYECSQNESVAKTLVDRILARLTKS